MDENSAITVTRMQALSSRTHRIYLALTLPPPRVSVQVQALCAIELTGGSMSERERERERTLLELLHDGKLPVQR